MYDFSVLQADVGDGGQLQGCGHGLHRIQQAGSTDLPHVSSLHSWDGKKESLTSLQNCRGKTENKCTECRKLYILLTRFVFLLVLKLI